MEYELVDKESVSMAVVRAVSSMENRTMSSLRPLSEIIDPDALDLLFAPGKDGSPRVGGRISFIYSKCKVTIESNEYLTVELLDTPLNITILDAEESFPIEFR